MCAVHLLGVSIELWEVVEVVRWEQLLNSCLIIPFQLLLDAWCQILSQNNTDCLKYNQVEIEVVQCEQLLSSTCSTSISTFLVTMKLLDSIYTSTHQIQ